MKELVTQSYPTLRDPVDCSPPGSSVHGILQASMLEWVAFPSPGDLPGPGIELGSPTLQADSLPSEPPGKPHKAGQVLMNSLNFCSSGKIFISPLYLNDNFAESILG